MDIPDRNCGHGSVARTQLGQGVGVLTYIEIMSSLPEPWLRGPITGLHPLLAPVLYTFQQAREDLARYTEGLTPQQIWATPHGFGSVGFHLRHIAGSTDRLFTYLQGAQLSDAQFAFLKQEEQLGTESREELLAQMDTVFRRVEASVREMEPATLTEPRSVGRQSLPTTVNGLLVHIAEHTQRHVGQAISAAKLSFTL